MGLLDSMEQTPQQPQGGLLGGMMQGSAPAAPQPQGGGQEMQLAMQLAQSPTPQTAQAIVEQMRQAGLPEAEQFAAIFEQVGDNPEMLKQIADASIQALSGQ